MAPAAGCARPPDGGPGGPRLGGAAGHGLRGDLGGGHARGIRAWPARVDGGVTEAREKLRGYLAVTAAATLWGVSGVVAKSLFNREARPRTGSTNPLTAAFGYIL